MKEKSVFLILLCYLLFSMSNGYRMQRIDALDNLNDTVLQDNDNEIHNENHNETNVDHVDIILNGSEDHPEDPIHDDLDEEIHEENINKDPEAEIHEVVDEESHEGPDEELVLDVQLSVTDPASDEGVEGSLETTQPGPDESVEGSLESSTTVDDTTTIDTNSTIGICDGTKTFVSHTRNCSLFYDCTNEKSSSCPHGMWFDPNYVNDILCQYPEVICAADNNICDCAEQYPPPTPDPLMEDSVTCLKDNRFHLIPSQVSCGRYFVCHNEMAYRMECRQGLHFNPKTETCDYPEVVNCRIPDPDCPTEGIKFLPDSTRCEVFYFCVHGFKTKQVCPFYHIWDIRSNSCRRQDEAVCHLDI